ncbi:hypothetical protein Q5752_007062 [Cryptotrichosporon argae]
MASLLLSRAGKNESDASDAKARPRIPKVALYVSGAAFALTVGLTALVLPLVRQAAKYQQPPQFIAWKHRARPLRTPRPTTPAASRAHATVSSRVLPPAAGSSSSSVRSQPHPSSALPAASALPALPDAEATWRARAFNDREEDRLYGRPLNGEGAGDDATPVSPWLGFQALGIATAGVLGAAGLGAWAVSWALGVGDMDGFNARVRALLADGMPALVDGVHACDRADGTEARGDIDDDAVEAWVAMTDRAGEEMPAGRVV